MTYSGIPQACKGKGCSSVGIAPVAHSLLARYQYFPIHIQMAMKSLMQSKNSLPPCLAFFRASRTFTGHLDILPPTMFPDLSANELSISLVTSGHASVVLLGPVGSECWPLPDDRPTNSRRAERKYERRPTALVLQVALSYGRCCLLFEDVFLPVHQPSQNEQPKEGRGGARAHHIARKRRHAPLRDRLRFSLNCLFLF